MVQFPVRAALCAAGIFLVSGIPSGAEPVTATDLNGRAVSLDKPAERIVMIPIPSSSTVIALDGGTDRLVGMHPLAKSAIEEAILGEFFPAAKDISSDILASGGSSGFAPNVEAIAALDPDLVVQWGHQGEDIVAPLTNAGLNTALIQYGTEEKARDIIRLLGTLIGKPDKVDEIIAWRDGTAARIEAGLEGLADEDRPSVLYLLRAQSELRVSGTGSYNDYYINLAGGRNAAAEIDGLKPVNAEQIAAWNPDVILLNGFESELDVSRIYDDPVLGATNAAINKRVYKMPIGGYRWDPPSQESPLTWQWLATLLHPDRFDFDIRGEIATWYDRLYGRTPTAEQTDAILRVSMNGGGANYDRFIAD
ncbi:ABC transporter substrate-binding protein [Oricola thermophila]|uniref:ABC transporter substrate-binding protein n=1 Tax=Oricola thermophila TaxID=2742145 RepID=A0A6N1VCC6_9HYPH|nr:ABC transporter substrate-binding protein [Oricola thermophila]QKV18656.1 ABC transporter substrate-binding protein [Oricola thermophila]